MAKKNASGGASAKRARSGRARPLAEQETQKLLDIVQAERDKLAALVNSMSDEVWLADRDKRFTLMNPSAVREFALASGEEVDVERLAASLEVYRPDGSPRPVEEAPPLRALRGEMVRNQEELVRTPGSGELRYRQVSATPVRDADGKIVGSVSVVRDITAQVRTQAELAGSEQRLLLATQAAGLGIYDYDPRSDRFTWDQRIREIWGVGPDEEITHNLLMAGLHPDDRASVQASVDRALDPAGPRRYHIEHRVIHRQSGVQRWVATIGAVFFDQDRAVRLIGTIQDITEQKQAQEERERLLHDVSVHAAQLQEANEKLGITNEDLAATNEELRITTEELQSEIADRKRAQEALQASRRMLETVVNHMPASVALIRGSDLRLQLANPAYQAIAPGKKMIGKTLNELWPETGQDFAALCRRVLETGAPYEATDELNMIRRRPDGPLEAAYFSWSLHRVRLPGDDGWGLLLAAWETTARRQAEEALRQSEDRLRLAQVSAGAGVWDWDIPSGKLEWSPEFFRLFGLDPNTTDASFDSWRSVLHPEDRVSAEKQIETAVESHSPLSNEYRVVLSSGDIRWIRSLGNTTYDSSGRPQRMLGICLDVTERRQAEEALRESEERFRHYFELGLIGMAITSPAKGWIEVNDECCRLLGYERDELAHKTWAELTYPDDLAADVLQFDRVLAGQIDGYTIDKRFVRKNGQVVDTTISVAAMRGAAGKVDYFVVLLQDITERKRAEDALRQSKADLERAQGRLQAIFEAMPAALFFADETGRIVEANRGAKEVWGGSLPFQFAQDIPEYAIYKGWWADTGKPLQPEDWALIRARTGETVRGDIVDIERFDGTRGTVMNSAAPVYDGEGHLLGTVAINQDITERRRMEEELRELNATLESKVTQRTAELERRAKQLQKLTLQLSQAEEQERRRIAVILHEDLQQQIAGAKFHLSLVRGRAREDRQRTDIDAVDEMLKGAIEKSRTLSRDLSPAVLHMNDLAELLQWLANRLQAQQGLRVNLNISGDMMLHSEALATFLFRAAQEMLFNVVKHAHVREAAVRVRRIRRYVCLSVSDQGRGFDPQELRQTAGLGLFSIRERTELLGGRLRVTSAKGKGSKLSVMVPDGPPAVAPPPSGVTLPQPGAAGLPFSGALRVLLVDDHDVVRAGLAALLRDTSGIELVGEAPDGREAITLAVELRPDVVIMDVSMPLMSGDQATRQIKTHLPQTRVIALSMYDEAEKKEKMFEAGAEAYILKTVSAEELLAAIRGEESPS